MLAQTQTKGTVAQTEQSRPNVYRTPNGIFLCQVSRSEEINNSSFTNHDSPINLQHHTVYHKLLSFSEMHWGLWRHAPMRHCAALSALCSLPTVLFSLCSLFSITNNTFMSMGGTLSLKSEERCAVCGLQSQSLVHYTLQGQHPPICETSPVYGALVLETRVPCAKQFDT